MPRIVLPACTGRCRYSSRWAKRTWHSARRLLPATRTCSTLHCCTGWLPSTQNAECHRLLPHVRLTPPAQQLRRVATRHETEATATPIRSRPCIPPVPCHARDATTATPAPERDLLNLSTTFCTSRRRRARRPAGQSAAALAVAEAARLNGSSGGKVSRSRSASTVKRRAAATRRVRSRRLSRRRPTTSSHSSRCRRCLNATARTRRRRLAQRHSVPPGAPAVASR